MSRGFRWDVFSATVIAGLLAGALAFAQQGNTVVHEPGPTTGSGSWVRATSPALVTPALGVANATSLALGGATIGSDALAVTGSASISSTLKPATVVVTGNGSKTAPSYAFTGATGSGWYWRSGTAAAFAQGGVESIQVSTSGNFSIGGNRYGLCSSGNCDLTSVGTDTVISATAAGVARLDKDGSGGQPTVSGLGTCNSAAKGARAMVTDATVAAATNFGVAVTGGGGNVDPVFCDGTSWKIG